MTQRIVHIDDNPTDLRLFEMNLKKLRPATSYHGFDSVLEGLAFCAHHPPTAIIVDHSMPDFDANAHIPALRLMLSYAVFVVWTAVHPSLWGPLEGQGIQVVQKGDGDIQGVLDAIDHARTKPVPRNPATLLQNGRWAAAIKNFFVGPPFPVFFVWGSAEEYGKIAWCNDTAISLFGWTQEEFRTKSFMDFTRHKDVAQAMLQFQQLMQGGIDSYQQRLGFITARYEESREFVEGMLFAVRHPSEPVAVVLLTNYDEVIESQKRRMIPVHAPIDAPTEAPPAKKNLASQFLQVLGRSNNPLGVGAAVALVMLVWWLTFGGGLELLLH